MPWTRPRSRSAWTLSRMKSRGSASAAASGIGFLSFIYLSTSPHGPCTRHCGHASYSTAGAPAGDAAPMALIGRILKAVLIGSGSISSPRADPSSWISIDVDRSDTAAPGANGDVTQGCLVTLLFRSRWLVSCQGCTSYALNLWGEIHSMDEATVTVSIRDRLLKERNALLDLSTRNRLLNTPLRTRNNRAIEIVDEKADEIFRLLTSNKTL